MTSTINASLSAGVVTTADTSGVLQLQTGGTAAVTVDASQNVGIGVTPSAWSVGKALEIGNVGNSLFGVAATQLTLTQNAYYSSSAYRYGSTNRASRYDQGAGTHAWFVAASGTAGDAITFGNAKMTLDESGNLLVGTTSSFFTTTKLQVTSSTTQTVGIQQTGGAANACVTSWNTATSGTIYQISFADSASGIVRGSITTNGTGTNYGSNSDYRLKENIAPMTGALAAVSQLKPCTFTWKENGADGQGFIAHELQEVCPDAVIGEKDAVNEDGSIKPQGIDTSFLVATLTAAIQEQQAIITSLTDRITALEGTTP